MLYETQATVEAECARHRDFFRMHTPHKANEQALEFIVRALVDMKFSSQKQQKLCSCNGLHGFHNFLFLFHFSSSPELTLTHTSHELHKLSACFIFVSFSSSIFCLSWNCMQNLSTKRARLSEIISFTSHRELFCHEKYEEKSTLRFVCTTSEL